MAERSPAEFIYCGTVSSHFSITRAMTTEEGVYGLILVSGLILSLIHI